MKIKFTLLLSVLAAGLVLTGCASTEDSSSQPSAPHTHSH